MVPQQEPFLVSGKQAAKIITTFRGYTAGRRPGGGGSKY